MSVAKASPDHAKRTLGGPRMILQLGGLFGKWTLDLQGQGFPFP